MNKPLTLYNIFGLKFEYSRKNVMISAFSKIHNKSDILQNIGIHGFSIFHISSVKTLAWKQIKDRFV